MADKQKTVTIPSIPPKLTKRIITQLIVFGIAGINLIISLFTGNSDTIVIENQNIIVESASWAAYILPILYGMFQGTSKRKRAEEEVTKQVKAEAKEATRRKTKRI